VILPVVGLLLLLGLFWYWASTLIGDDGNSPGATSTSAVAIVITPENPTATVTSETNLPVQTTEAGAGSGDQATGAATNPASDATNPPATDATTGNPKFAMDDIVTTNDSVNMRSDPTTTGDLIITLDVGVELTIIGGPETADNYTWWQVQDQSTGDEGWVVEDALDAQ
jgi:uncharacterized protein YgiM (DUF1202 family)